MSGHGDAQVKLVEALMLEKFRTEPFHNLYLRYGYRQTTLAYGGTCSDKTLSFYRALRALKVTARLHSAFIGGAEIHRLVKVQIAGKAYFADVGNGWPSIHLLPLHDEVEYECFGMRYRSVIQDRSARIYNTRKGTERMQVEIPFESKPEEQILADIDARFSRGIEYPFSRGLRFSQVVRGRFIFLRDDRLEIYEPTGYSEVVGIEEAALAEVLHEYFGFDIGLLGAPR
jgi:arylamine N-acetyltransferase